MSEVHAKSLYSNLVSNISNKKVLLIAPGVSSAKEKDTIISFIMSNDPVVISINYDYPHYNSNYVFISNMRRFRQLSNDVLYKTIITSNIESSSFCSIVEYKSLLNDIPSVRDNAGLMAIQLMMNLNASEIFLAGFDGYNFNNYENYESDSLTLINAKEQLEMINTGLRQALCLYEKKYKIYSLTCFTNLPDCIELEKLYIKNT
jgi:4-hydroxy 2-oxovalerate aldolase